MRDIGNGGKVSKLTFIIIPTKTDSIVHAVAAKSPMALTSCP